MVHKGKALLGAAMMFAALVRPSSAGEQVRVPVLLELFTSEGCSSCPPADDVLETLDRTQPIAGAELIVLSEHVDYWDTPAWKDPFSSHVFTARQSDYAREVDHSNDIYTPEMVIDGRAGVVGSDSSAVKAAIERAATTKKKPLAIVSVLRSGSTVVVHVVAAATGVAGAALYVALATDYARSHVLAGENAGRTLSHVAVVRSLQLAGRVPATTAIDRVLTIPLERAAGNAVRIVALIQQQQTGAVLALASRRL